MLSPLVHFTSFCLLLLVLPLLYTMGIIERTNALHLQVSIQKMASGPSPRSGSTGACSDDGRMFIFGGYCEEEEEEGGSMTRHVKNDIWCLDPDAQDWKCLSQTGGISGAEDIDVAAPNPRLCAASAIANSELVLFGGWDPQDAGTGGVILEDVWAFHLDTHTWRLIDNHSSSSSMLGGPTSRHVAVSLPDGRIVLHTFRCTDHVLVYNHDRKKVTATAHIERQTTTGIAPGSLGLHTATVIELAGRTYVCVFGGATKNGDMTDATFLLDTETWEWKKVQSNNTGPTPRAGSVAASLYNSIPIIYGGAERNSTTGGLRPRGDLWALHLTMENHNGRCDCVGEWEQLIHDDNKDVTDNIHTHDDLPPPRNAAVMQAVAENKLLLVNGWHPFVKSFGDCHRLSFIRQE